jgi:histone H3/H4
MNFEQEIRTLARRAIMEEINNLGIKALLREQIVDAGFSHDEIRSMIREAIDSFCRSALNTNDVAGYVRAAIDNRVNQAADKEINKILGRYSSFSGNKAVEDALLRAMLRKTQAGYDVSVTITPKTEEVNQ